ncbi:MAG: DUF4291 domain-containing protein [Prevotella sp.]|nr:DUF4291 domain-containing protein [Alistipes senegalensis]MCM1358111.1 DUF4291 domain-containing protein [Prevotella sp.]MCM1474049.1 DUF4291 domain-containing protein [Muribaculaceae bacterium]
MNTINAIYNNETIRVYQAFNERIAEEVVRLGTFGKCFKKDRMTWIKPSFLWIMYRSGWAEKENQEHILAIDIKRTGFEEILKNAVMSSYNESMGISREEWKRQIAISEVRCQFDPDRDIYGNPQPDRTIQLGLRGGMVEKYISEYIVKITDITENVKYLKSFRDNGTLDVDMLPVEKPYPTENIEIAGGLNVKGKN